MTTLLETPVKTIDGTHTSLAEYAGDVLLVVNVASKCGLTPQYEALEGLYRQYRDRGFKVLGFPANDFGGQEPVAMPRSPISARRPMMSISRCSPRSWSPGPASTRSLPR